MSHQHNSGANTGPTWRPSSHQQRDWPDQHRQPPPPSYGDSRQYNYPPQQVPQHARGPPPPPYRRPPTSLTMRIPPFPSSGSDPAYGQQHPPPQPPPPGWYDQQRSGSWHEQHQPPPPQQYSPHSYPRRQYSYDDRPYMPMHTEQLSSPYPPHLTPRQSPPKQQQQQQRVQIQFRPTVASEKRDFEEAGEDKQQPQQSEQPMKKKKVEEEKEEKEETEATVSADNEDAGEKLSKEEEEKRRKDNLSLLAKVSFAMHDDDKEKGKGKTEEKGTDKDETGGEKVEEPDKSEVETTGMKAKAKGDEETEKGSNEEKDSKVDLDKELEKQTEEDAESKGEGKPEKEEESKADKEEDQDKEDTQEEPSSSQSLKVPLPEEKQTPVLSPGGSDSEQKVETPKSSNKSPILAVRPSQFSRQVTPIDQRRQKQAGTDAPPAAYQRSLPRDYPRSSMLQREYGPYPGYGREPPPEVAYPRHDYPPQQHSPSRYGAAPMSPNHPYGGPPQSHYRDPHAPSGWEPRPPPPDPSVWRRPTYEPYHDGAGPALVERGSSYEDEQQQPRGVPRSPSQYYHYPRDYPQPPTTGGEWSDSGSSGHPPPYYSRPDGHQYHDPHAPPYTSPSDPRSRPYSYRMPHTGGPGAGEPSQITPPSHHGRPQSKPDDKLYQTAPYSYVQQPRLEEKTLLRKKFSWKHYPELERFLISNRDEYLRHSALNYTAEQKQYNNWLTERLLEVAAQHRYEFDPKEFNFVAVRDRIRCYYKSYVQTARKRGLPIHGKTTKPTTTTSSAKSEKQEQEPRAEPAAVKE